MTVSSVIEKITDCNCRTFDIVIDVPLAGPDISVQQSVDVQKALRKWVEQFKIDGVNLECEIGNEVLTLEFHPKTVSHLWVDTPLVPNSVVEECLSKVLDGLIELGAIKSKPPIQFMREL